MEDNPAFRCCVLTLLLFALILRSIFFFFTGESCYLRNLNFKHFLLAKPNFCRSAVNVLENYHHLVQMSGERGLLTVTHTSEWINWLQILILNNLLINGWNAYPGKNGTKIPPLWDGDTCQQLYIPCREKTSKCFQIKHLKGFFKCNKS